MEGTAQARFCRGSARKMRRVAALVRGLSVDHAAAVLRTIPKFAAVPLSKVILSARANALATEGTAHHHASDFVVTLVTVDGGPMAKRIRAVGMGRAYRIRKRYCHIKVRVSDDAVAAGAKKKPVIQAAPAADATAKSAPAKTAEAKPAKPAKSAGKGAKKS